MKKMPTLFEHNWSDPRRPIVDRPNPACAWGLVFHHPDGRMGKIKPRDFGLKRPKAAT